MSSPPTPSDPVVSEASAAASDAAAPTGPQLSPRTAFTPSVNDAVLWLAHRLVRDLIDAHAIDAYFDDAQSPEGDGVWEAAWQMRPSAAATEEEVELWHRWDHIFGEWAPSDVAIDELQVAPTLERKLGTFEAQIRAALTSDELAWFELRR